MKVWGEVNPNTIGGWSISIKLWSKIYQKRKRLNIIACVFGMVIHSQVSNVLVIWHPPATAQVVYHS